MWSKTSKGTTKMTPLSLSLSDHRYLGEQHTRTRTHNTHAQSCTDTHTHTHTHTHTQARAYIHMHSHIRLLLSHPFPGSEPASFCCSCTLFSVTLKYNTIQCDNDNAANEVGMCSDLRTSRERDTLRFYFTYLRKRLAEQ